MEIIYFIIASFLVVIVPGPTVSLIIANSLKFGIRAGILNVVGTQLGLIFLIILLALGFKAISPFLEDVIKIVRIIGAFYLMILGYLSFTTKNFSENSHSIKKFDKKFILQGLIVILSNPKAFLFLGAFIPQFIDITQKIENQIIYFGILFMIVGAIFDGMYAVVFGKFREIIINKYINILNKLGGSLLFFVGFWLLLY
jgi:homoserine/homoserine lactone efflux protein|tara:strand:+ start:99 stop:695 length:597 start_codon:yes stop_codon:yes gene_type:complete